jgi:hypothetical protein
MTEKFLASKEKPYMQQALSFALTVLVIEFWNLRFICNLVLEIWDFIGL